MTKELTDAMFVKEGKRVSYLAEITSDGTWRKTLRVILNEIEQIGRWGWVPRCLFRKSGWENKVIIMIVFEEV
jgi:hypothetical protein